MLHFLYSNNTRQVLLPDANVNDALNGIVGAYAGAAGQRCMALSVCKYDCLSTLVAMTHTRSDNRGVCKWLDHGACTSIYGATTWTRLQISH